MRKLVTICIAAALLAAVASAYAAAVTPDSHSAGFTFSPRARGSNHAPSPLSFVERLGARSTSGNRPMPLTDIKVRIYGLVADGKDFPTCSLRKIKSARSDKGCPSGALVGTGAVIAELGLIANPAAPGEACDPMLHVWNAGQGKLVFFFLENAKHVCLGGIEHTGDTDPYPGTYRVVGKYLVMDTPIPTFIDYPFPGLESSLLSEKLTFSKLTRTVHGRTVAAFASVGCAGSRRPWSATFTTQQQGSTPVTDMVSGRARC